MCRLRRSGVRLPPPLHLAVFNADKDDWEVVTGEYGFLVGGSSRETPLSAKLKTAGQRVN